jgi:hypothetical protein
VNLFTDNDVMSSPAETDLLAISRKYRASVYYKFLFMKLKRMNNPTTYLVKELV